MEIDWNIFGSAAGGATLCAALARAYVSRLLRDLEETVKLLNEVKTDLIKVTIKLEHLEELSDDVNRHGLKLAALEQAVYADTSKGQPRKFPNGN